MAAVERCGVMRRSRSLPASSSALLQVKSFVRVGRLERRGKLRGVDAWVARRTLGAPCAAQTGSTLAPTVSPALPAQLTASVSWCGHGRRLSSLACQKTADL
jgi:hypothetical protein